MPLIPETAPFNAEQRAWLNGFLAGWLGIPGSDSAQAGDGGSTMTREIHSTTTPPVLSDARSETEPEPWHEPFLPIEERLRLAEGKPIENRLMAALAQLDCGTCGYLCKTYSAAIASGEEKSLTLCTPGGSQTLKALKRLVAENPTKDASNGEATHGPAKRNGTKIPNFAPSEAHGWSRKNPFTARLLRSVNLNGPRSEKTTHHVEIDLKGGPEYEVGDSLGLYPENCSILVDELVSALDATGDEPVVTANGLATTLRDALGRHCCLNAVGEGLLERLAQSARGVEADELRRLIDDDEPIAGHDVLDVLRLFPSARPSPADLVPVLAEIKPRLYSISSSPRRHAGQVHLTVRRVVYEFNRRRRKGVASTMLADRAAPGSPLRVFVQKSHGFTLPSDPDAAIIMIGPGTGIAPFRAFLHDRDVQGAKGRNWLYYGDQRGSVDFLYRDELADFLGRGILTRLDTAFSRDQDHKVYVQQRLIEQGAELFDWLEGGAHVYVCGDARRMAADVDRALHAVIRTHGEMSAESAAAYVSSLSSAGRYSRDVY